MNYPVILTMAIMCTAILGALYNAVLIRGRNTKKSRRFIAVLNMFLIMNISDICFFISIRYGIIFLTHVFTLSRYLIQACAYPYLIRYILSEESRIRKDHPGRRFVFLGVLISADIIILLAMTNPFTHLLFSLDSLGMPVRGPLFYLPDMISGMQMLVCAAMIAFSKVHEDNIRPLLIFCILPVFGALSLAFDKSVPLLNPLSVLSVLLIYMSLHVRTTHELQKKELELAKSRLNMLMSQIRPHFLFNIMNTIYYLCDSDPQSAARAVEVLKKYIRGSFDDGQTEGAVDFETELSSVRTYTELEHLRFDQIEFIYDIQTDSFRIPPLTLQPLVENAVRHGCREMDDGKVIISSRETDDSWIVEVRDNGIGFDSRAKDDGRRHIGIENVRFRLNMISNAQLDISGLKEGGTIARISIPKQSA